MAEIHEYYGVSSTPTSDYLAHYGIRGMKWGVRKAIKSGDTQKLNKQYQKAQKKLAKLEKQASKTKKNAVKSAAYGAGALAAGKLALTGTKGAATLVRNAAPVIGRTRNAVGTGLGAIGSGISKLAYKAPLPANVKAGIKSAGAGLQTAGRNVRGGGTAKASAAALQTASNIEKWGKTNSIASGKAGQFIAGKYGKLAAGKGGMYNTNARNQAMSKISGISNDTIARVGAGAVAAGLGIASARNAYKAATAKKKAEKFRTEMNKAFAGTQYGRKPSGASKSKKRRG